MRTVPVTGMPRGPGVVRRALLLALVCLLAVGLPAAAAGLHRPAALERGTQTGLPLPRFARLKSGVANLRRGPGLRYPIAWVYRRRDLPVLILREFGNWRLLRLPDGTRGWMHRALLTGGRSFVVTARRATVRGSPSSRAAPVARLRHGVIGALHRCERKVPWCAVRIHGYSGFVRRTEIWGSDGDARSRGRG